MDTRRTFLGKLLGAIGGLFVAKPPATVDGVAYWRGAMPGVMLSTEPPKFGSDKIYGFTNFPNRNSTTVRMRYMELDL